MRDVIVSGPRPWGGGTREVTDDFNQGIKDRLDGKLNWADAVANNLSPEKYRELPRVAVVEEERRRARAAVYDEADKFLALNPEIDNSEDPANPNPNGAIFKLEMQLRGIDPTTATCQDFQDSHRNLKAAGIPLRLKQDVVRKQRDEKNRKDAEDIKAREHFNEEEAYAMSKDELRRRAGEIF